LIAAYTSPEEVQALKKQLILMNIDSREKWYKKIKQFKRKHVIVFFKMFFI
jgi:hypothetical protein